MLDGSVNVWEEYGSARDNLKGELVKQLRIAMEELLVSGSLSDVTLVSSDKQTIAAHLCILKKRAPGFYTKYIYPTLQTLPRDAEAKGGFRVFVSDVDSEALRFFLKSIYTDEEAAKTPKSPVKAVRRKKTGGADSATTGIGAAGGGKKQDESVGGANKSETHEQQPVEQQELEDEENQFSDRQKGRGDEEVEEEDKDKSTEEEFVRSERNQMTESAEQEVIVAQLALQLSNEMAEEAVDHGHAEEGDVADVSHSSLSIRMPTEEGSSGEGSSNRMTTFKQLAGAPLQQDGEGVRLTRVGSDSGASLVVMSPESLEEQSSNVSALLLEGEQAPAVEENVDLLVDRPCRADSITAKFIHVNDTLQEEDVAAEVSTGGEKKIFPFFIDLGKAFHTRPVLKALDSAGASLQPQANKRHSIASVRSIDSMDVSPLHDDSAAAVPPFPLFDSEPCCRLAKDLLDMFVEQKGTDVKLVTADGAEKAAHKCILAAMSPYFANVFEKAPNTNRLQISTKSYSQRNVNFAVSFLYGGLSTLPDDVSPWQLIGLASDWNVPQLKQVALLHLRANVCHMMHYPCAGCAAGVFGILAKLEALGCEPLLSDCLQWQAAQFRRLWRSRAFIQADEATQQLCFHAVSAYLNADNVCDALVDCDRLQATLPRHLRNGVPTESVQSLAETLYNTIMGFIVGRLDEVVMGCTFLQQGKGLAINLSLFESFLPGLVRSSSPDVVCRTFMALEHLLLELPEAVADGEAKENDFNERFVALLRRLYELCDTQLIHCAAAVVKCNSWAILSSEMQERIKEIGIFVEIERPRAAPPKLSSSGTGGRRYRRSASAGVGADDESPHRAHQQQRAGRPVSKVHPLKEVKENSFSEEPAESVANEHLPVVVAADAVPLQQHAEQQQQDDQIERQEEQELPEQGKSTAPSERKAPKAPPLRSNTVILRSSQQRSELTTKGGRAKQQPTAKHQKSIQSAASSQKGAVRPTGLPPNAPRGSGEHHGKPATKRRSNEGLANKPSAASSVDKPSKIPKSPKVAKKALTPAAKKPTSSKTLPRAGKSNT